jgi:hypothetical protein
MTQVKWQNVYNNKLSIYNNCAWVSIHQWMWKLHNRSVSSIDLFVGNSFSLKMYNFSILRDLNFFLLLITCCKFFWRAKTSIACLESRNDLKLIRCFCCCFFFLLNSLNLVEWLITARYLFFCVYDLLIYLSEIHFH